MLDYYRFKQVHELYLKGRPDEARSLLQELQSNYVAACDENTSLRAQIQEYEDILYISKNLVFDGNSYWLHTGSIRQGPFCPECYNKEGLLVRLSQQEGQWRCNHCASHFGQERTAVRKPERPTVAMGQRVAKVIPLYK
ncbi:hypothetical protein [Oleidesulfovibrio sp.]|uniref:hypothetical protein n=1 Tax=Oleidesulfovibrio sp. TaxID=2909707 RepID=UPI003A86E65F